MSQIFVTEAQNTWVFFDDSRRFRRGGAEKPLCGDTSLYRMIPEGVYAQVTGVEKSHNWCRFRDAIDPITTGNALSALCR